MKFATSRSAVALVLAVRTAFARASNRPPARAAGRSDRAASAVRCLDHAVRRQLSSGGKGSSLRVSRWWALRAVSSRSPSSSTFRWFSAASRSQRARTSTPLPWATPSSELAIGSWTVARRIDARAFRSSRGGRAARQSQSEFDAQSSAGDRRWHRGACSPGTARARARLRGRLNIEEDHLRPRPPLERADRADKLPGPNQPRV